MNIHGERGPSVAKKFFSKSTPSLDKNSAAAGAHPSTWLCSRELLTKMRFVFILLDKAGVH
jgi:hypothetical protein